MQRCALFVLGFSMWVGCGGSVGDRPVPDGGILFADGGTATPLLACASAPMRLSYGLAYVKPMAMLVDATDVYWLTDDGGVRRVSKSGGDPATVYSPNNYAACAWTGCGFTMDATDVYVSVSGSLTRVSKKKLSSTAIVDVTQNIGFSSRMVAVDATNVYTMTGNAVNFTTKAPGIWNGPLWSTLEVGGGAMQQIVVDGTDAFVATTVSTFEGQTFGSTALWRAPISGAPATKLATVSTTMYPMVLDGSSIYMLDAELPRVIAVDTTSGEFRTVGDVDATTKNLAVDSTYAYWTFAQGVRAVPKSGGAAQPIATFAPSATSSVVGADDQCVYWIETTDGATMSIVAAPKPQ